MTSWKIGKVKITRIIEMEFTGGTSDFFPDALPEKTREIRWMYPHFMNEIGELNMSIHALVLETPTQKIVVDTCIGNDKERSIPGFSNLQTPFLDNFNTAGFDPNEIDTVLCTHLHVDHVGWNTMLVNGKWVPTFPQARYLFGRKEYDYWSSQTDDETVPIMNDSVNPVFEAGLVDLVEMDHQLCKEVSLEPTPGHTPGHVSVRITSEGQEALITGDSFHHPCQIAHPEWCCAIDYSKEGSKLTREKMLEKYSANGTLIIGTHFATPTAGYFKKKGEGYILEVFEKE